MRLENPDGSTQTQIETVLGPREPSFCLWLDLFLMLNYLCPTADSREGLKGAMAVVNET
jgi:hypothetical protein